MYIGTKRKKKELKVLPLSIVHLSVFLSRCLSGRLPFQQSYSVCIRNTERTAINKLRSYSQLLSEAKKQRQR